jgi:transcription elongation factor GreA
MERHRAPGFGVVFSADPDRPARPASRSPAGALDVNNKPTYISKDGLERLRAELEEMVTVRRPEIAQRIHDAKEHGDLTENAEYEDAKNEQAFVEGRIQALEMMIKNATLIDEHTSTDHVQIGSTVKVKGDDGLQTFLIVGSAEAKPADGRISNESPVGRALLGRRKGEKIVVKVPAGDFSYTIVEIS